MMSFIHSDVLDQLFFFGALIVKLQKVEDSRPVVGGGHSSSAQCKKNNVKVRN